MTKHKVTVVIPNYNNENYVGPCLDSILDQTHENIEIIIVDDASTDRSRDIIDAYRARHSNIIAYYNETNTGVSRVRDKGISACTSKYLTSIDSDDYFINEYKIADELNLLLEYEKIGRTDIIAYSNTMLVSPDGTISPNNKPICSTITLEKILTRECMIPRDFMFTIDQYKEIGGHDYELGLYEDWDFKIRLAANNTYKYCGNEGIGYRQHDTGLSSSDKEYQIKWAKYVLEKNLHYVDPSLHDQIRNKLDDEFINPMRGIRTFKGVAKRLLKKVTQ